VNIYDPIPVKMFQNTLPELEFRTKDGVLTSVKTTIMWHVTNAAFVARFAGIYIHTYIHIYTYIHTYNTYIHIHTY
jgi:hypothetical protein